MLKLRFKEICNKISSEHVLKSIIWESTLRCTMNCLHCGSDCKSSCDTPDMPKEDFYRFILEIKKMQKNNPTFITISGGEPLLRKDIFEIGEFISQNRFTWGVVTNGILLDENLMKNLILAGISSMCISVDGLKKSHEWLRGVNGSWEKTMNAVRIMTNASLKICDVITCVNQKNITELEELYQLLIDSGLKKWRLAIIFPKGRAKDNKELMLSAEQFHYLMNFIQNKRIENKMKISFCCDGFLGDFEFKVRNTGFFCRAGINTLALRVDGSLSGCLSIREGFDQGNIYHDDLQKIWNEKFERFRNKEWMHTGICTNCKDFEMCKGNSMHLKTSFNDANTICYVEKYNLS